MEGIAFEVEEQVQTTPDIEILMFGAEVKYEDVVKSDNAWNDILNEALRRAREMRLERIAAFGTLKSNGDVVVITPGQAVDVTAYSKIEFTKYDGPAA